MADRPSTSGGLASRSMVKNDFRFDKRISKDDSFLRSRAYGEPGPGTFTRFRGQPPTPDSSPKTVAVSRLAPRTRDLEIVPNEYNGNIGMAFGSPGHPPTSWDFHGGGRPMGDSTWSTSPPISRGNNTGAIEMPITRKPSSRWKLFGIFGRKQSDHTTSLTSATGSTSLKDLHRSEEVELASQTSLSSLQSPARSNTSISRKTPKHKPIVIRSQTLPLDVEDGKKYRKTVQSENGGEGESGRTPVPLEMRPTPAPTSGPLLNVEIPDIRMERYSVMFNSVLNSNPSLLSRRQGTAQKLKSVEDDAEREQQEKVASVPRRATSPQPATRRSGLGLFPASRPDHQTHHKMHHKLSPRVRSNTSPALLPSPSRPNFAQPPIGIQQHTPENTSRERLKHHKHISYNQGEDRGTSVATEINDETQGTVRTSPQFSNARSNLILDSPTEIESEGYEAIKSKAWNPLTCHPPSAPNWQETGPSSDTSSYRKRSPSLAPSSRTQITIQTEIFSDEASCPDGNSANNKMTAVEISIARQISMSRQQRKLLQPLHTGPPSAALPGTRRPPHASPARTSPLVGIAAGAVAGDKGRIVETKKSTPTLVHPPDTLGAPTNLTQLRKSEQIILDGV